MEKNKTNWFFRPFALLGIWLVALILIGFLIFLGVKQSLYFVDVSFNILMLSFFITPLVVLVISIWAFFRGL